MDINERNKNIYEDYIYRYYTMDEICNKYDLKESTIRSIISKRNRMVEEKTSFMSNLYIYLMVKYPKDADKIYNRLFKYLNNHDITRCDDIVETIISDTPISGVGQKYRGILREYLEYRIV